MVKRSFSQKLLVLAVGLSGFAHAETLPYAKTEIVPPTPEYLASVWSNAPAQPTVKATRRQLLVFSLRTGYDHQVIPHVNRVFEILGEKSGAFTTRITTNIEQLTPAGLASYDVLVLNNNCSKGPRRNLLLDELESNPRYAQLTADQCQARAAALEQSVLKFVSGGKGLVVMHGAPTLLNNSEPFTEMVGAAFDYHPPNQAVTLRTVEKQHPLAAAFIGAEPFIHRDEPYCFNGAYAKLDFRPLLEMEVNGLKGLRQPAGERPRYVSWIRPFGQGRVFYCSPSHFPESYQSPTLLRYILDGVQYAIGDLKCDDSTPKQGGLPGQ